MTANKPTEAGCPIVAISVPEPRRHTPDRTVLNPYALDTWLGATILPQKFQCLRTPPIERERGI